MKRKRKAKQSKEKKRGERERKRDDLANHSLTQSSLNPFRYESQLPNFLLSSTLIHLHLFTWEASVYI